MKYEVLEKKNLLFGLVWGALAILLGNFLVTLIEVINQLLDMLLQAGLYVFTFPVKLVTFFGVTNSVVLWVAVLVITVLSAPFIRKAFKFVTNIFRRSKI